MEKLFWPPMITREIWPQFWYIMAKGEQQAVSGKSWGDIESAVEQWLMDQSEESQLIKAEESLDDEMRWYGHDWRP